MTLFAIIMSAAALLITILGIAYAHGKVEARIETDVKVLDRNYTQLVHTVTRIEGRIMEIEARQKQILRLVAGEKQGEKNA